MIDPIDAAPAAAGARLTQTTTPARSTATGGGTSFAGELARSVRLTASGAASSSAAPSTVKAEPRPDSEQTKKISGHAYARIENGADKGMYLNQLSSSPRAGAVFRLVERDDRVFHVYGAGTDKVVVEVKRQHAATSTAPTGGTRPAAT